MWGIERGGEREGGTEKSYLSTRPWKKDQMDTVRVGVLFFFFIFPFLFSRHFLLGSLERPARGLEERKTERNERKIHRRVTETDRNERKRGFEKG